MINKWEVWIFTEKGSAIFARCDSLLAAKKIIAAEKEKLWLRLPTFFIYSPEGEWIKEVDNDIF